MSLAANRLVFVSVFMELHTFLRHYMLDGNSFEFVAMIHCVYMVLNVMEEVGGKLVRFIPRNYLSPSIELTGKDVGCTQLCCTDVLPHSLDI